MQIGLGIGIPFNRGQMWNLMFGPSGLFLNNAATGVWYDPSDINVNWRRNLLTYTEQFDNSVWGKARSSVASNVVVAPDGTLTGDKLVEDTSVTLSHYTVQSVTTTAATHSTSVYAKAAERSWMLLENVTAGYSAYFDLASGLVGTISGGTASITSVGNGWYRCSITGTATAASNAFRIYVAQSNNTVAYTGDGTSGIYTWGAQLELGSTASTYQKITDGIQDYYSYQAQPVLFQDAAGTTPVTAIEQPVGLMLDKSKGLVLGPELVTNGDGSTLTGWSNTPSSWWTVSGSRFYHASSANYNELSQTFTKQGSLLVTFDYEVISAANTAQFFYTNGAGVVKSFDSAGVPRLPSGKGTYRYVITDGIQKIGFSRYSAAEFYIDNISVREIPGNHAYQTTSTSRPVLSARVNLLTKTEQFDDAVWSKINATVTANAAIDPNGNLNADKIISTASTGYHAISCGISVLIGTAYTYSVYAKSSEYTKIYLSDGANAQAACAFDLQTATAGAPIGNATGKSATITSIANGWYRCSLTFTASFTTLNPSAIGYPVGSTLDAYGVQYTGDGTSGAYIWGADLRVSNDGVNIPAYQRVNTSTDYDTVGFPTYLRCDGVDDSMVTNSIDFTYTDKMAVFAGVRKLSDAVTAPIELSAISDSNNGSFALLTYSGQYAQRVKGVVANYIEMDYSNGTAPVSHVVTMQMSLSATSAATTAILRQNTITSSGSSAGTSVPPVGGNFGNYPLFIGRRGGTSLPFNGRLYQLIVAGGINLTFNQEDNNAYLEEDFDTILLENTDQVNQNQLEMLERFVNSKTKAY